MNPFVFALLNAGVMVLLVIVLIAGLGTLWALFIVLKKMVRKQLDEQMEKIIPIKGLRNRISLRIKWR